MRYLLIIALLAFLARFNFFRPKRKGILILLYHSISEKPDKRYKFSVSKRMFEWQMKFLKKMGFTSILPSEMDRVSEKRLYRKNRYVIISFDDGYSDNLIAAKTMKRHGFNGIFFISTAHIGKDLQGRKMMNRGDLKTLVDMGMALGSHSHTHIKLSELSSDGVEREIKQSLDILRQFYNVEDFAYPFGDCNENTISILKKHGIKRAYIIGQRIYNPHKDDPYRIPRAIVRRDSTKLDFYLIIGRGRSKF